MKYEFGPWTVDINMYDTQKYYKNNDDSIDKKDNARFMNMLSEKQTHLFKQLGIDLEKIRVECHKLPEEIMDIKVKEIFEISFLICGKLLSITLFQAEVYGSEDVFGKDALKGLEIIDSAEILHDIDGMSCSFKHPCTTFPEKNFEDWDCGFICGKMILKK